MFEMSKKLSDLIEKAQETLQDTSVSDIDQAIDALGPHYGTSYSGRRITFKWDSTGKAPSPEEPIDLIILYISTNKSGKYGNDYSAYLKHYSSEWDINDWSLTVAKDTEIILLLNGNVEGAYVTHKFASSEPEATLYSCFRFLGSNPGTCDCLISYPLEQATQVITIHNKVEGT